MNCPKKILILVAAITMSASVAWAGGDPVAGKDKSVTCTACHGQDGMGIDPQYPILASQYADYLELALKGYRDGTRKNIIMGGFAAALTDQDIEDLAAFYASLPGGVSTIPKR